MIKEDEDSGRSLQHATWGRGATSASADKRRATRSELDRLQRLGAQTRGISHDFGNLLMVVATQLDMARMDCDDASAARAPLGVAQHAVAQAQALVDRLNAFAKGGQPRHLPVDLSNLVAQQARLLRAILPDDVTLVEDLQVVPPIWIEGDAVQLGRVLTNLAMNARDALPNGGRLTLTLNVHPAANGAGLAVLQFEDTGIGMDAATVDRVFEPFFTTKSGTGGNGLGLPIIREIVAAHGGEVEICSRLGCGTRVTVCLPMPARIVGETRQNVAPEAIVMVSGDVPVRAAASAALLEAGYTVVFAANGAEVLGMTERSGSLIRTCVLDADTLSAADLQALATWGPWAGLRNLVVLGGRDYELSAPSNSSGRHIQRLAKPFRPWDLAACVAQPSN